MFLSFLGINALGVIPFYLGSGSIPHWLLNTLRAIGAGLCVCSLAWIYFVLSPLLARVVLPLIILILEGICCTVDIIASLIGVLIDTTIEEMTKSALYPQREARKAPGTDGQAADEY
jgi:hypothetical protein